MKKILIIQTAFIGDVILATSLIEETRHNFPNSQIDFLLRSGNQSIIETNPNITNLFVWTKNKNKYRSLFSLLFKIRKEKYDTVLNIQRFFNSGILTAFSGAKKKIGFHSNPLSFLFHHKITHKIPNVIDGSPLHEVQRNSELLAPTISNFKIKEKKELCLKLYFNQSDEEKIQILTKDDQDYFVLAPSSVWYTKQWHASKWTELIIKLQDLGKVYLIGAPADFDYTSSLATDHKNIVNLCGELTLRESAKLMEKAQRVFVNDSAPLHLASSVNARITAIFCSTSPQFGYTPIAENAKTISLFSSLECLPCGLHGHKSCPKDHFKCAMDIEVDSVFKTIKVF